MRLLGDSFDKETGLLGRRILSGNRTAWFTSFERERRQLCGPVLRGKQDCLEDQFCEGNKTASTDTEKHLLKKRSRFSWHVCIQSRSDRTWTNILLCIFASFHSFCEH